MMVNSGLKGLKLPAWSEIAGSNPTLALKNVSSPLTCTDSILWGASYRKCSNFEVCVWRAVSSHSSNQPPPPPIEMEMLTVIEALVHRGCIGQDKGVHSGNVIRG